MTRTRSSLSIDGDTTIPLSALTWLKVIGVSVLTCAVGGATWATNISMRLDRIEELQEAEAARVWTKVDMQSFAELLEARNDGMHVPTVPAR